MKRDKILKHLLKDIYIFNFFLQSLKVLYKPTVWLFVIWPTNYTIVASVINYPRSEHKIWPELCKMLHCKTI